MTTATSTGEPVLAWMTRRSEAARASETDFDDAKLEYKRLFTEVWGTFLLVLVAAGGGVVGAHRVGRRADAGDEGARPRDDGHGDHLLHGHDPGAHLNPAVTLAFAVRGNFPWRRVPGYIIAEVLGAILASLFLQLVYGGILNGATEPAPGREQGPPS